MQKPKNKRLICKGISPEGKLQFMLKEETPVDVKLPSAPVIQPLQPEESRDQENRREREHQFERSR